MIVFLMTGWHLYANSRPVFGYFGWRIDEAETLRALPFMDRIKYMEWGSSDGSIVNKNGWPDVVGKVKSALRNWVSPSMSR